jgi:hypothetical protein
LTSSPTPGESRARDRPASGPALSARPANEDPHPPRARGLPRPGAPLSCRHILATPNRSISSRACFACKAAVRRAHATTCCGRAKGVATAALPAAEGAASFPRGAGRSATATRCSFGEECRGRPMRLRGSRISSQAEAGATARACSHSCGSRRSLGTSPPDMAPGAHSRIRPEHAVVADRRHGTRRGAGVGPVEHG